MSSKTVSVRFVKVDGKAPPSMSIHDNGKIKSGKLELSAQEAISMLDKGNARKLRKKLRELGYEEAARSPRLLPTPSLAFQSQDRTKRKRIDRDSHGLEHPMAGNCPPDKDFDEMAELPDHGDWAEANTNSMAKKAARKKTITKIASTKKGKHK